MNKQFLAGALALSLLGGASALAQGDQHHGGGPSGGGPGGGDQHGGAPGGGQHDGGAPGGGQRGGAMGGPSGVHVQSAGPRGGSVTAGRSGGPVGGAPSFGASVSGGASTSRHRAGSSGFGGVQGGGQVHGGSAIQHGGARPHYDAQNYPHVISAQRHYHWQGNWSPQPGYSDRRWGYGDRLPFGWFARQYWVDDYYDYDLGVPPYGYMWVRAGDDALLVDLRTGEVVEVEDGVFY